ncbi:uncharacterized protein LOC120340336 [Styela clava]
MPKRKKRTTLKPKSTLSLERTDRIDALYEDWKSTVDSERTMIVHYFETLKRQTLARVDQLMLHLPPETLNMTVKEFIEFGETECTDNNNEQRKVKQKNIEKENIIPTEAVVDAVDKQLQDLINIAGSSEAGGSDTQGKKTTRKRKPPKTTRKKAANKMVDTQVLETPCHTTSVPESWQDTPFLIPQRSRIGSTASSEGTSSILLRTPANSAEIKTLIPKSSWLSERGSPIMWAPTNPNLRKKIEQKMREIEEIQRQALQFGDE